jgi:quercetin dioxygenase-like cupin family protein
LITEKRRVPGGRSDGLAAGGGGPDPNFVAARLDETENRSKGREPARCAERPTPTGRTSLKKLLIAVALVALAGSAVAQDAMKVVKQDGVTWTEHPVFKGAQAAILIGDPTKAEIVVTRTKFPPNYKVPPHTHPMTEIVTVMSGSLGNAAGEKFDPSKGEMLSPGSVFTLPAKHPHYVWTTDAETIVQVQYTGPTGVDFVNPADDPRKK